MARLKRKTRLIRSVARQVAEKMAAEGDSTILDAAEELAYNVKWVSVDGALEVILCTALRDLERNGQAGDVAKVRAALERYDEGEKRDD
jgi:hypothetical protein